MLGGIQGVSFAVFYQRVSALEGVETKNDKIKTEGVGEVSGAAADEKAAECYADQAERRGESTAFQNSAEDKNGG